MKNHRRKQPVRRPVFGQPVVSTPETVPYLDQIMVQVPCYEPNSHSIAFTGEDLTKNILVTGSVGSGKTSAVVNRILAEAIAFKATDPIEKLGLLILDPKGDQTVEKVRELCGQHGRQDDLVVIDGHSNWRVPLFPQLQEFSDVDRLVSLLSISSKDYSLENAYWSEHRRVLLSCALTLLAASVEHATFLETMTWLDRFISRTNLNEEGVVRAVRRLDHLAKNPSLDEVVRGFFAKTVNNFREWKHAEERNAKLHASCMRNLITPFIQLQAGRFMGGGVGQKPGQIRGSHHWLNPQDIINQGKIVVVSIPEQRFPEQARLICSVVKAMFYAAIAERNPAYHCRDRLVLLIMDEYPLMASGDEPLFGDVGMLATGRSRRLGVVAVTQALANLQVKLGVSQMQALLGNFNTQFFMRGNDPLTGHYAETQMKTKVIYGPPQQSNPNLLILPGQPENWERPTAPVRLGEKPVCPIGALGKLAVNQCFLHHASQEPYPEVVELVPLHLQGVPDPKAARPFMPGRQDLLRAADTQPPIQLSLLDEGDLGSSSDLAPN